MLDLENVNSYYGDSHILRGVSLSVRRGEIVCLLGRNGAGKTTTILTVMGYLQPRPGRIRYNTRDIAGLPPYAVARLGFGFVPQERGIFPSLTVRENLTVFARTGAKGCWSARHHLLPGAGQGRWGRQGRAVSVDLRSADRPPQGKLHRRVRA